MRMRALIAAIVLLGMAMVGFGEMAPRPGKAQGYFVTNRWGEPLFVRGSSVYFVSPEVSTVLAKNAGSPLEVDVSEWKQEMNPGAVMMVEMRGVEVVKS